MAVQDYEFYLRVLSRVSDTFSTRRYNSYPHMCGDDTDEIST